MLSSFRKTGIRSRNASIQRQSKTHCEICESKFQLITHQQGQCKRCLKAVCDKCNNTRIKLHQPDQSTTISKVCNLCKKEDDLLSAMVKDNNLVFQMSSILGQQWLKKLNKQKLSFQDIINQYEEMKFMTNQNTIKFKSQSRQICGNLFKCLNYSLRQFLGKLIEQINDQAFIDGVINVTVALYAYLKDMPYVVEIVYFVVFMLCFCSQSQCFFIISRFITRIYPQYLRLDNMNKDNLLRHELKTLLSMYSVLQKSSERTEMAIITGYLQQKFKSFVQSFSLNLANVIVSFYLIDEMITTNSYIYFYQGIISLVYHAKEVILNAQDFGLVQKFIHGYVGLEKIKSTMITFEKSNIKFEMEHEFFDSVDHRKLHEKYLHLKSLYQKSEEKYHKLDNNYKSLSKDHQLLLLRAKQNEITVMNLQEELVNAAEKLVDIEDLQLLKQENQLLQQKIKVLEEQLSRAQAQFESLNKKYFLDDKNRSIYLKLQQEYQREIVDLKTKNQVLQIEKLAHDINFKTSYIDQRFEEKNRTIAQLEQNYRELENELQYYRNYKANTQLGHQRYQQRTINESQRYLGQSINNISAIGRIDQSRHNVTEMSFLSYLQPSSGEERTSLKKVMDANKQLIDKLKSDLKYAEQRNQYLEAQVDRLSSIVEQQRIKLELMGEINDFINQIPEELNYQNHIQDLQKIIQNENNLHKKTQLEGILLSYRKCVYEVRFRSIDAKLKENKIKQQNYLSINRLNTQTDRSEGHELNDNAEFTVPDKTKDDVSEQLNWFGDTQAIEEVNKKAHKKEECSVM